MLDEISCKVEIRACHLTGIKSSISEVMTLSTLLDHCGVSVSAAILMRFGAIRYRLTLPSFKSPDPI